MSRKREKGPSLAQLTLPSANQHKPLPYCEICGGRRTGKGEFTLPDGMVSLDVDSDLCLECAIQFWRAFKYANPNNRRLLIIELLRAYPATQESVDRDIPLLTEKPQ